jgi:hypothetical protein
LVFRTAGSERMRITSGGLITAGTSSSNIGNNIRNWTERGYIELSGDLTGYAAGGYTVLKSSGAYIYFDINGSYAAYLNSSGTLTASDERLKENVTSLTNSLNKIQQLRGVNFTWIDQDRGTGNNIGFIAHKMAKTTIPGGYIETGSIDTASLADTSITADKLHTTLDLTGKTITVATATAGDNDTTVASTAFVSTAIANLAPLASPTFTGTLTASGLAYPTSDGTNGQVLTTDGSGTLSFSTVSGYTDSDVATYLGGGNTINIDTQGTIKLDGNYPVGY